MGRVCGVSRCSLERSRCAASPERVGVWKVAMLRCSHENHPSGNRCAPHLPAVTRSSRGWFECGSGGLSRLSGAFCGRGPRDFASRVLGAYLRWGGSFHRDVSIHRWAFLVESGEGMDWETRSMDVFAPPRRLVGVPRVSIRRRCCLAQRIFRSRRMRAERPWASRPSTALNTSIVSTERVKEARSYWMMEVLRWNISAVRPGKE